MRKFFLSVFCVALLFVGSSVRAQTQAFADLYPPDVSAFPDISALLDVYDSSGRFASGLNPQSVSVIEDGKPLPATELIEMAVPAQIVVAINPGPPLDVRDTQGLSKYQRLIQVIGGWAQNRPADMPDDFSLVSLSGSIINHASARDFLVSLNTFQPDFRASVPNLQSLAIAIDTVSAQTPRPGMKRAILFVTPHMDDANILTSIEPYIQKAREHRIAVFVWFVDLNTYFVTNSAAAFNTLAMQTGGSMFAYSGMEQFPDPESYFAPLRRVYALKYASGVRSGGAHTVRVEAQTSSGKASSMDVTFNIDIQPPNPMLVNPPLQITRQAPPEDPFSDVLEPNSQTFEIIVEFPDGHPRAVTRAALYVDGQLVAEDTQPPIDPFVWDLQSYTTNGQHEIYVEAEDALGLSKTSISIPITVTVVQPPSGVKALFAKYRQQITIGAIALAGLALLTLLFGGRLRGLSLRAKREEQKVMADPLTQPLKALAEDQAEVKEKKRGKKVEGTAPSNGQKKSAAAPAYLVRIQHDGQPVAASPIPILESEMSFGTDPVQCNYILDDPSIASLHARLKKMDDGNYMLFDCGSVAGAWVNYEPIARDGFQLTHGDVVHFGQLVYRFQLDTSPPIAEPRVTPETTPA